MIEHGQRVYGSVCDSCGEMQTYGTEGAGLERYDDPDGKPTDHEGGYWLLCDKCRPVETTDDGEE